MRQKDRLFFWVALLLTLTLTLVACERPVPDDQAAGEETTAETDTTAETGPTTQDEAAETESEAVAASEEPAEAEESGDSESTPRVESEEAASEEVTESGEAEEAAAEEPTDAAEEAEAEVESPAEAETSGAAETTSEASSAETTESKTTPATHTVAVGENLYRIGLKYNISWVTLAEFNDLNDADRIEVGQLLNIPGEAEAKIEPTPSPLTETTYTVKAGDNLYRIGLLYGISWVQIAEANGLVSPNQIIVGQVLKIPVDTPGPTPQFTHQVKAGETLLLISLQYGVPWPTIAEANNISSPYVIFSGQTLVIPGG